MNLLQPKPVSYAHVGTCGKWRTAFLEVHRRGDRGERRLVVVVAIRGGIQGSRSWCIVARKVGRYVVAAWPE